MPDFVSFNSGCQPLLSSDACAGMSDANGDDLSDGVVLRFGEGERTYLIEAQALTWQGEWGPGSTLAFYDDTYGQHELLGHYRLDEQLVPRPLGAEEGSLCTSSPEAPVLRGNNSRGSFVWPDGTQADIWAGDDAIVGSRVLSWMQVLVRPSADAKPRFEVATEGVHLGDDEAAMVGELSETTSPRDLAFVPAGQVPAPLPQAEPQRSEPSAAEQAIDWLKSRF